MEGETSPVRKRRPREHIIADLSVNHVERYVLRCGHSAERVRYDYGADLLVSTYDANSEIESGLVYMQLKATDMLNILRDRQTIAFPLRRSDLELWLHELMPYILVVYDAQSDVAYWLYVQAYFDRMHDFSLTQAGATVTVRIPKANVVDEAAIRQFAHYKNDIVRQARGVIRHEG